MTLLVGTLADGHHWLRVADPSWENPLDPSYAGDLGGRWNPPGSFPTLYLNEDVETARAQVIALLDGSPIEPADLDGGFDLVVATLPRSQDVAEMIGDNGLEAAGLPATYPNYANGRPVRHDVCQKVGANIHDGGLRGVRARSAVIADWSGRELAWFPARPSSRATSVDRIPFTDWWYRPV